MNWIIKWFNKGCGIGAHDWEIVAVYVCMRRHAWDRAVEHQICLNCGKQINDIPEAKRLDHEAQVEIDRRQRRAREMAKGKT